MKKISVGVFILGKVIVLLSIALLIGCHKLESGVVRKKYFVAAHNEMYTTVISNGKTVIPIVQQRFVPDKWYITIEGEYNGKTRKEDFSITESEFEKVNIGDFIKIKGSK